MQSHIVFHSKHFLLPAFILSYLLHFHLRIARHIAASINRVPLLRVSLRSGSARLTQSWVIASESAFWPLHAVFPSLFFLFCAYAHSIEKSLAKKLRKLPLNRWYRNGRWKIYCRLYISWLKNYSVGCIGNILFKMLFSEAKNFKWLIFCSP